MKESHGFELLNEREIPELKSIVRHYRHVKTGAELLSLQNDDENKAFGITFRTPPADSTGVAHILEHAVLCGSEKYPLKDPFAELLKSSLHTYLNASTYPDKTCYPVASLNLQDFYHLVEVYLDLALHPLLSRHTFQEQGWHYELDDPDHPLSYKGVVFNEMKGAYSNPDSVLGEQAQQSLFPGHTYGVDSGGDPRHIPDLTHEQLRAFHAAYYHPSNSRSFFYGDDDPTTRLQIMDKVLSRFDRRDVDSEIPLQARFDAPKWIVKYYAADEESGEGAARAKRSMVSVNWLLEETTDQRTRLGLDILNQILIGTSAAPLRKALIDSGLGNDIAGGGLQDYLRQSPFSIGMKGIDAADAEAAEAVVLDTLKKLSEDGIDPDAIDSALNTIEFNLREFNTGQFPKGLAIMVQTLSTWLYGGDPIEAMAFEAPLTAVKERAKTAGYFEGLIRRYLLDNPHRTTLLLQPDPTMEAREVEAETARLTEARARMTRADLAAIHQETLELKRLQEAPDSPEALAKLPALKLSDLDKKNKTIPIALLDNGKVLFHDLFTSGILYLDVGMDLHSLPPELLPYTSLFGRALLELGTEKEDEVRLIQRIGRETGGIWRQSLHSAIIDSVRGASWLFIRGKAMSNQAENLTALLRDILLTARLDHPDRFRQMVLEEKTRMESRLAPSGSGFVDTRLRSAFHESGWAVEQTSGIGCLFFLRDLAIQVDNDWHSVLETLEKIRKILVNRSAMFCNVTLDEAAWKQCAPGIDEFLATLPSSPAERAVWPAPRPGKEEGMVFPSPVNYVGKAANLFDLGYELHGSSTVITNYLNASWLWERVRKEGGAYGVGCSLDTMSGVFVYTSYRDPNLLGTLETYDGSSTFLRRAELSESELTRSIIGAIGGMDRHLLPDAKGFASMARYLTGNTDERRQRLRDEVLSTTNAHFRTFADVLDAMKAEGRVVVLGSQTAIDSANESRPGWLDVVRVM